MDYREKTIESRKVFKGNILNLRIDKVLLPDGNIASREIVEHNGGVGIVAVKDGSILLVRQYRKPIESVIFEIPAGKLEGDEDPHDCAFRELEEETGYIPGKVKLINKVYPSPGFSSEKLYIYLAEDLKIGKIHRDKDEFMDSDFYNIPDVVDMIKNGIISDAKTICGLLSYTQGLV
ncbi:MAG TPA: ADP-ribose pyrophosphatase [Clostridiaceae bacterium]|nr:ADP-ribose pyrophosphatase [Clostridiaceae bacterium]